MRRRRFHVILWLVKITLTICLHHSSAKRITSDGDLEYNTQNSTYKVFRLFPANWDDVQRLAELRAISDETTEIDFWLDSQHPGQFADVMVSPIAMDTFAQFLKRNPQLRYKLTINDVQKLIYTNEFEPDQLRKQQKSHTAPSSSGMALEFFRRFLRDVTDQSGQSFPFDKVGEVRGVKYPFGEYTNYATMIRYMRTLEFYYPNIVQLIQIGTTHEGRSIEGIKIGHTWPGRHRPKRAFWIDGNLHAREWASGHTALFVINQLVSGYGKDPAITHYVNHIDIYIVPVSNPDGFEYSRSSLKPQIRLWRKNRSPEQCARTIWGGRSCCQGVDLNRNFDFHWAETGSSPNPCSNLYAGKKVFSEPESRAIADFLRSDELSGRVDAFITLHTYAQMWIHPFSHEYQYYPADVKKVKKLALKATARLREIYGTQYRVGTGADLLAPASGGSDDWAKEKLGVKFVYLVELRPQLELSNGFILRPQELLPTAIETFEAIKVVIEGVLQENGLNLPSPGDNSNSVLPSNLVVNGVSSSRNDPLQAQAGLKQKQSVGSLNPTAQKQITQWPNQAEPFAPGNTWPKLRLPDELRSQRLEPTQTPITAASPAPVITWPPFQPIFFPKQQNTTTTTEATTLFQNPSANVVPEDAQGFKIRKQQLGNVDFSGDLPSARQLLIQQNILKAQNLAKNFVTKLLTPVTLAPTTESTTESTTTPITSMASTTQQPITTTTVKTTTPLMPSESPRDTTQPTSTASTQWLLFFTLPIVQTRRIFEFHSLVKITASPQNTTRRAESSLATMISSPVTKCQPNFMRQQNQTIFQLSLSCILKVVTTPATTGTSTVATTTIVTKPSTSETTTTLVQNSSEIINPTESQGLKFQKPQLGKVDFSASQLLIQQNILKAQNLAKNLVTKLLTTVTSPATSITSTSATTTASGNGKNTHHGDIITATGTSDFGNKYNNTKVPSTEFSTTTFEPLKETTPASVTSSIEAPISTTEGLTVVEGEVLAKGIKEVELEIEKMQAATTEQFLIQLDPETGGDATTAQIKTVVEERLTEDGSSEEVAKSTTVQEDGFINKVVLTKSSIEESRNSVSSRSKVQLAAETIPRRLSNEQLRKQVMRIQSLVSLLSHIQGKSTRSTTMLPTEAPRKAPTKKKVPLTPPPTNNQPDKKFAVVNDRELVELEIELPTTKPPKKVFAPRFLTSGPSSLGNYELFRQGKNGRIAPISGENRKLVVEAIFGDAAANSSATNYHSFPIPLRFANKECADEKYSCVFWIMAQPAVCSEQKRFMKRNCALSCGFCDIENR